MTDTRIAWEAPKLESLEMDFTEMPGKVDGREGAMVVGTAVMS